MEFSVSMCVYGKDNPEYFHQAMESVLQQTRAPDEIVLVVDGPVSDTLHTIIQKYETHDVVHVIWLSENKGHGVARRCGLEACTKALVALMDADDICAPGRFEKQLAMFQKNPALDVVGGNLPEFQGSVQHVIGRRMVKQTDAEIKEDLKKRCPFNQQTVMARKETMMRAGGYLDWFCNEDYYLWIRLALCHAQFANLNEDLVYFRVTDDVFSRRGGWRYFSSEAKLQKFMWSSHVISLPIFLENVIKRFIVQVCMTNGMRQWVYHTFARATPVLPNAQS